MTCITFSTARFNGATGFRRWKRLYGTGLLLVITRASMGPPAFAGGNLIWLTL